MTQPMPTPADAGSITVDTSEPGPPDDAAEMATPEETNMAKKLSRTKKGRERLKEVAEEAFANFDQAWENSEENRSQTAANWKLFAGDLEKKSYPFKDCANVNIPIMLENVTRIAFRAYAELFGDWNNVFGVAPIGEADEETAKLLTLHGNWQIRNQIPDFKRQMMRGMLAFFAAGDVVCHSYWDPDRQQNRHEMLTADEFVVPYMTSTMPDYSDVPFRCRILGKHKADLKQMKLDWVGVDDVIKRAKPTSDDEPEKKLQQVTGQALGFESSDRAAPYNLLWYEGWFDVGKEGGFPKKEQHWCKVVADFNTRTVMEFSVLEEVDWQDQQRFDSQSQELATFHAQTDQFHQAMALQQEQIAQTQGQAQELQLSGAPPEQVDAIHQGLDQAAQVHMTAQPPPPPGWVQGDPSVATPEPPRTVPVHLFTHFVNIEPMEGNVGLGQGRILADFNRAANTAANQFADSATLSNVWCVIVADGVEFDEKFEISPGKVNKATGATGQNIRDSIIEVKPTPANPQLLELVTLMDQKGQTAMQSPSVLSGDPGKSGETFRGLNARIEQATKTMAVPTGRFGDALCQVLKNNAMLNSMFMKDEELFHIAEGKGLIPKEMKIGRAMYARSYHVEIRSDLRFTAQSQKVQEADENLALFRSIPQLENNFCLLYQLLVAAFKAREMEKLIQCLGPPPPAPPTLAGFPPPPAAVPGMPQQSGAPGGVGPSPVTPPKGVNAPKLLSEAMAALSPKKAG
jgi:hypothetical protein